MEDKKINDLADVAYPGRSLRDHFAGLAMQAMLSNPALFDTDPMQNPGWVANRAFGIADAMIEARSNS